MKTPCQVTFTFININNKKMKNCKILLKRNLLALVFLFVSVLPYDAIIGQITIPGTDLIPAPAAYLLTPGGNVVLHFPWVGGSDLCFIYVGPKPKR